VEPSVSNKLVRLSQINEFPVEREINKGMF
jgi:hypothetical protein